MPEIIATAQYGCSERMFAAYLAVEDHAEADPRFVKSLQMPNRPFCERQVMPRATWHASRMFREVMQPFGLDSALGTYVLVEDDGVSAAIGLVRGLGDPDFTDDDVARFHLYLPHFREAIRGSARVHRAEAGGDTLAELFDGMRVATAVTDRFGTVPPPSTPPPARSSPRGRRPDLRPRAGGGGRAWRQPHAARRDLPDGGGLGGGRSPVWLPRRGRPSDLLVSIARTGAAGGDDRPAHRLLAVLFVLDPEQRYEGDAEALQRLFGLTQAEAAVMVSVGAGHTPRETAATLGRSYETVRSHLKSLYGKTGTGSQADLVGLVRTVASPGHRQS